MKRGFLIKYSADPPTRLKTITFPAKLTVGGRNLLLKGDGSDTAQNRQENTHKI
jgi:hypothetical protein